MTVHCRIMKIDIEKFSVDLTCRTSDLMDKANEWKLPKDSYYDFDTESEDQKTEEELKKKQQRTRQYHSVKVKMLFLSFMFKQSQLTSRCRLASSSIHQACDRPPKLPQHQLQPGREDDGDPGPGRPDHQAQQQGREPPHCHLEGKTTRSN